MKQTKSILSPLLFAVASDWVLRRATKDHGIAWSEDKCLADLDFADDIAAFSDSAQSLQRLGESVSNAAEGLALVISANKTKNMLTGEQHSSTDVVINNNKIENVENFTYLGRSINNQGNMGHELNCRVGKASAAFS